MSSSPPSESMDDQARRPRSGATVLLVEDDPDQQWRLARLLTVHGHRVVGTSTADGALALLEQWPMDLVLVDERLPGIEGVALLERLRLRHPALALALMSEAPDDELEADAARLGVLALLAKPVASDQVTRLLEELRRARGRSAPPTSNQPFRASSWPPRP